MINEYISYLVPYYSLREILLYFIIYSFIGWVIESTTISIWQKKVVNSGFLRGPFCPIYGTGAIIILTVLAPFKDNIIILFIVSIIVMSVWEYYVSWIMEVIYDLKWWDYSEFFLNINGRICLLFSLAWGFLSIILIKWIHPIIEKVVNSFSLSNNVIDLVITCFIFYYIIDTILISNKIIKIKDLLNKKRKSIRENIMKSINKLNINK